jgi:NAD(P)-dependent dehydrogenase (short-subunit alcohol dehydrogenase family)
MGLKGKNIIITGASRGIGRDIALLLGKDEPNICIVYLHSEKEANDVKKDIEELGGKAFILQCDVSNSMEVKKMFQKAKEQFDNRLDILINNAGIVEDSFIKDMSDEAWDRVINNNLSSVFYCLRETLPIMIEQKYGKVINISSTAALIGNMGQANYSAAKAGVIALTKTAALEGSRYGIRVNAVCPGIHKTDMIKNVPDRVLEKIVGKVPLGCMGTGKDVAGLVRFLAVDDSDYITGQAFSVNGGLSM